MDQENKFHNRTSFIHLTDYKRQYIPSLNDTGQRVVWINCFCEAHGEDWKKNIVGLDVMDGGNCFFNLKINLSDLTFREFAVHSMG